MGEELVTVAEPCSLSEMDLLRSRLQAAGIDVFVPEELGVAFNYPPVTIAELPMRLQVLASQAHRAIEVLGLSYDEHGQPNGQHR